MIWDDFIRESLLPAVLTLLSAFVTALVAYLVQAVNRWAEKQKVQWVGTVMTNLTLAAQRAVLKTNQVFVDNIREAMEDGELTQDDAAAAMNMAKRTMRQEMGDELWNALLRIAGSESAAERVMESLIESQVGAVKLDAAPTV